MGMALLTMYFSMVDTVCIGSEYLLIFLVYFRAAWGMLSVWHVQDSLKNPAGSYGSLSYKTDGVCRLSWVVVFLKKSCA